VSKESIFSGLNNLPPVYSVLSREYSSYFGFTEEELNFLLEKTNLKNGLSDIKNWYNGYRMGDTLVYNPWSIVNCIKKEGELAPYWVNTSDNSLIKYLISHSSMVFKAQFSILLQGGMVEQIIDENLAFEFLENNESAVWSLLLMSGYLKVVSHNIIKGRVIHTLAIPNEEVRSLFRDIIDQWFSDGHALGWYNQFLNDLLLGNLLEFEKGLQEIMLQIASVHDMAKDPEAFFHGFFLGLSASLHKGGEYELKSNRESGYGRYDVAIFPRDHNKTGVIMEFKMIDGTRKKNDLKLKLKKAANEALDQIHDQGYLEEFEQRGIKQIIKLGLAFSGKVFCMAHEK
jgi:hypothetical protein